MFQSVCLGLSLLIQFCIDATIRLGNVSILRRCLCSLKKKDNDSLLVFDATISYFYLVLGLFRKNVKISITLKTHLQLIFLDIDKHYIIIHNETAVFK